MSRVLVVKAQPSRSPLEPRMMKPPGPASAPLRPEEQRNPRSLVLLRLPVASRRSVAPRRANDGFSFVQIPNMGSWTFRGHAQSPECPWLAVQAVALSQASGLPAAGGTGTEGVR